MAAALAGVAGQGSAPAPRPIAPSLSISMVTATAAYGGACPARADDDGTCPFDAPRGPSAPPAPASSSPATPTRARANLASYVSDADYPASAIRANEQGRTTFRLTIGTDGSVTNCVVTQSSGSAALDETTCRIMVERARFTPARDRRGRAVTDSTMGAIRWVLPEEEEAPTPDTAPAPGSPTVPLQTPPKGAGVPAPQDRSGN